MNNNSARVLCFCLHAEIDFGLQSNVLSYFCRFQCVTCQLYTV